MFASDQPILADIYFENVDILMIYIFLLVLIFWGVFNFVQKYINMWTICTHAKMISVFKTKTNLNKDNVPKINSNLS